MKCAVIDVGSNSMRLSVYDVQSWKFKVLFKEKIMAGLAGYVEDGRLTQEGIACAVNGLREFQRTLRLLDIAQVYVFATASLRNISNTEEAVAQIRSDTGFALEVITGEEEARFSYDGAMRELDMPEGVFVDIGGASTEIVLCEKERIVRAESVPVGSLKLFRDYVKRIIPGKGAQSRMEAAIAEVLSDQEIQHPSKSGRMACVGGTARAVRKLIQKREGDSGGTAFTAAQLESLWEFLRRGDKQAIDFMLRYEPERIHTLVPGVMILRHLVREFQVTQIAVSQYGVREGYLCQIQKQLER